MTYYNDNDIPARAALTDLDAVLARIQDIMDDLGDVPMAGRHFKYID